MTLAGRRIALVEDDEIMGGSIAQRLALEGAEVVWLKQAVRALGAIRTPRAPIDAVVCDIRLPDGTGEEVFLALCRTASPPPFLFVTGQGDVAQAVRLIRAGAADYITKPFEMRAFLDRLSQLVGPVEGAGGLLGLSQAAREVERRLAAAATGSDPILLLGEAGTGKGRLARRLHDLSGQRGPFRVLDLRSLPFDPGDEAPDEPGTLLLQGIDGLDPAGQASLLDWIDRGRGPRLVATASEGADAPSGDGAAPDLLRGRLAAGTIAVPPLRRRPEDALWLAQRLFGPVNVRRASPLRGFSSLAEAAVLEHDWPGNGREVRTRLVRGVAAATGDWLQPADLFPERDAMAPLRPLSEVRDAAERAHIIAALERSGGHMAEAARLLAVSRTTLWEKLQKLGL